MVERSAVNPWAWSVNFGFNQGELVEGTTRTLYCAGQTSVDENGAPQPPHMAVQITLAADNLEAVLARRGHDARQRRAAELLHHRRPGLPHQRRGARRASRRGRRRARCTLLGVASLAFPELLIEIEATAVA